MSVSVMFRHDIDPDTLFIPMIDARRMEVYTSVLDLALNEQMQPSPLILDETSYSQWIDTGRPILMFGNGSDKAQSLITAPNVKFISGINPIAADMLALSERAFRQNDFLDLAYSVPAYLKDFQATKPKSPLA